MAQEGMPLTTKLKQILYNCIVGKTSTGIEENYRKIRITANDDKNYNTCFYSLDVIIAGSYRVNSFETTGFRKWVCYRSIKGSF